MKLLRALKTGWVVWVWNRTPTCAQMSRLASLSLDQRLSLKVRFTMSLHYFICVWCKRYYRHLRFLRRAAPGFPEQLETISHPTLSADAKRRMVDRLRAAHDH
ncbi:MAG: hypothetical protein L0Z50_01490 [Verrucomicrobiales bacterium]|nr:hypothetical protein [Verrucomicrobiales bacterium]